MFNNMIEASWVGGLDYHVIRNLEARLENLIIIQQESDFPVQDATTITGEEGFAYMIVKPFTTNKTFIGTNCVIRGISTIIPYWTYTGTGYAIENSLESRVSIYDINIEATNGTILHIQGGNGGNILERMNIDNTILSGRKIIDVDGAGAVVLGTATISGINTPLSDLIDVNSTNMVVFNVDRVVATGVISGGSVVNFNNSTSQEYEISDLIYQGASDGYVFKGLPESGNVLTGGSFTCKGGNFIQSSDPLLGIGVNDIRSRFEDDNNGLEATQTLGEIYLTNIATANIVSQGVYAEMINGTFGTIPNGKIGYTSRGGIVNLSEKPVTFLVNAEFVLDVGGTKNIGVALYVDDGITETELPASHKDYSSNQDRPVSCIASVRLDTGDEVFPKFENNSNNATYTVNNYTLIINKTA